MAAADLLEKRQDAFAIIMAEEMGKPVDEGRQEAVKCALACRHYAKHGEEMLAPEVMDGARILHQPLGPVLAIMPWNFPFWQVIRFAAPSLMAGNTILLKHASNVPRCAKAIASLIAESFGRDDLMKVIFVSGKEVESYIAHPQIRAVTFTGSTDAGRKVAAAAGKYLKKSVLELGGSDAYVVLADADVAQAAKVCAKARMVNGGQSCIAAKRFLVATEVHDQFVGLLLEEMSRYVPGDPIQTGTRLGPMARADLRDDVHQQVVDSVEAGAKLLLGGEIPNDTELLDKPYYPATILTDVVPGMPVFDEETFGPVAAVIRVRDEAEAIEFANQSSFGLGGAVFGTDVERARRVAEAIETGAIAINAQLSSDPRYPFGGVKDSGWGRELGRHGILEFVNVKTVRA